MGVAEAKNAKKNIAKVIIQSGIDWGGMASN